MGHCKQGQLYHNHNHPKNDSDHASQDQLLSDVASRRELAAPAPPAEQAGLAYAVGCTCPAFLTYLT